MPSVSPWPTVKPDVMPVVLKSVDPEFSEQAREERRSGSVEVHVLIDEHGKVVRTQVAMGVGYGLDDKAVEAVRQYILKPAMKDGQPVACAIYIQVNFVIRDKN